MNKPKVYAINTYYWRNSLDDLLFLHNLTFDRAIEIVAEHIDISPHNIRKRYLEYLRERIRLDDNYKYMAELLERKSELLPKYNIEKALQPKKKHPVNMSPAQKKEFTNKWIAELQDLIKDDMPETEAIGFISNKYDMLQTSVTSTWRKRNRSSAGKPVPVQPPSTQMDVGIKKEDFAFLRDVNLQNKRAEQLFKSLGNVVERESDHTDQIKKTYLNGQKRLQETQFKLVDTIAILKHQLSIANIILKQED